MKVLLSFFLRFLLAPLLVIVGVFILNGISKVRGVLRMKKLVVFILLASLVLALPSLLGLLKNEFVWFGLLLSVFIYLILGVSFNLFTRTGLYKSIGLGDNKWLLLFAIVMLLILSSWIYYLAFSWLSGLPYTHWAMFNVLWFTVPILYVICRNHFVDIPAAFYKLWIVDKTTIDYEYWDSLDKFKLMQVTVRIKRKIDSRNFSTFSVKLPPEISIGDWFNKFIEDQNLLFPKDTIDEIGIEEAPIGWIFYTNKWFKFPLFTRILDPDKDGDANNIKSKQVIYIKRTTERNE